MLWFFFCVAMLLVGYFIYGKVVERIFTINPQKMTPAHAMSDGVDYMPMSKTKIWLIQLLNIAGTGPIFGPILGALYGPVAMLWIVLGCIFAGAVHDYFSGMLSVRNGGATMPVLAGKYLGRPVKVFINVMALLLLLLVGVVFVASPAQLMATITMDVLGGTSGALQLNDAETVHQSLQTTGLTVWGMDKATIISVWILIIFCYYILATLLPVDKIIGRIYPLFGALLLFMSIGMVYGLVSAHFSAQDPIDFFRTINADGQGLTWEKFTQNFQVKGDVPIWPLLFLTISCGALSGFHATQSPLMARCANNESDGRFIFYGAMITEGLIALVWCTVGLSFYENPQMLQDAISAGSPSKVVYDSSLHFLGFIGGIFAVLGVVVLPVTSGDTAFRAARLQLAEIFKIEQRSLTKRLMIAIPLFTLGFIVSKIDFSVLWRYFTWANQTTAMIMLWTAAAYLYRYKKFHWICSIPAWFITTVCSTYLFYNKIGFGLDYQLSVYLGFAATIICIVMFFKLLKPLGDNDEAAYVEN
ncbi:carbon starvation CstA family protein [[Haemophilus] ducreyi]|uniref:carbon starvation CstA family protein n=1 Tax=Haemophilus ducreyi TaxID=730 RepID=UPI0006552420|nr:carbon starvation protein A [[Haemophilus] ducreyi]AKO44948.1 carbon starvation protein CstA [[Haemophilus] ducreyi]AKO46352.1 carbon starvation protein CstA [[Haemophilus] ducreyi]AKO47697.1 carbon starvation protein CstA [[Haemophilus] ducreyi]AKO49078.1 carbon starvation protein CstA [[Haemophilus] ducreyi]ANF62100.1 carbon starvation protein CstA [[Haemophilus] ducreyi]